MSSGVSNREMALGSELEAPAREEYCVRTGKIVSPACLQSTQHEWLLTSVDGISNCGRHLVEIKNGRSAFQTTARTGAPPDYYMAQLQHALAVTGLDAIDYWCCWPGCESILIVVRRDARYIDRLLKEEERFWKRVQAHRASAGIRSVASLDDLV